MADPGDLVDDDVLRLVLMCCHPALAPEVASALALRLVVGVPTDDIARLFLVPVPTMAARITRGKRKVVTAGIPFGVPDASVLPERLGVVAQVAYLAFTAGYAPGTGPDLLRADLSGEAVRLVRVTLALRPEEPTLRALLALLLLQHSRRDARARARRRPRPPARPGPLAVAPRRGRGGPRAARRDAGAASTSALAESYRLQALVAAEHATADIGIRDQVGPDLRALRRAPRARRRHRPSGSRRPWRSPSGTGPGLVSTPSTGSTTSCPAATALPAVRGELLARLGEDAAAVAALDLAVERCANDVERDHLERRRAELGGGRG